MDQTLWPPQRVAVFTCTGPYATTTLVFGAPRCGVVLFNQMVASLTTTLEHGVAVRPGWAGPTWEPRREHICRVPL
jgi:hypothetical protein